MNGWLVALIGGVTGVISGGIASLAAPWSQWGVEKRRMRQQNRISQIDLWRNGIDELRRGERAADTRIPVPIDNRVAYLISGEPDPESIKLEQLSWYFSLQPHMSRESDERATSLASKRVAERESDLPAHLAKEVARIEKAWKVT